MIRIVIRRGGHARACLINEINEGATIAFLRQVPLADDEHVPSRSGVMAIAGIEQWLVQAREGRARELGSRSLSGFLKHGAVLPRW